MAVSYKLVAQFWEKSHWLGKREKESLPIIHWQHCADGIVMIYENTAVVAEWLPAAMLGSLATYVKISVTSRFDRLMLYHNTVLESWSIFPALVPFSRLV